MDDLRKEIVYFLLILIAWAGTNILGGLRRHFAKKLKKRKSSIEYSVELHLQIETFLTELRIATDSDRAYLIQFHNGEVTAANMHLCKLSCTHEKCGEGVSREKEVLQSLRIEDYLLKVQEIVTTGFQLSESVEDDSDSLWKQILLNKGVQSYMSLGIKDKTGACIGFVSVDFVHEPILPAAISRTKSYLEYYSKRIAFQLIS